jgi:transcriptional regulator with XRE-family HTH domain
VQDIQRKVGATIRELRKARGWTQEEFAERAGLDRTHLYRIENGKQSMTLRTLQTLAETLDVPVVRLLKGM